MLELLLARRVNVRMLGKIMLLTEQFSPVRNREVGEIN